MDRKTITIMVLGLIILSGVGVYAYGYVTQMAYNIGVQDTVLVLNNQIQQSLDTQGYIIFNYPINETNFIPIKLVPQT